MSGGAVREHALIGLEQIPTRHRARADAEELPGTLARAMDVEVGPVEDLDTRVAVLAALRETDT